MHIRIEPDFSLKETAQILEKALDVTLEVDESGYFEEFPAFFGVARNTSFALLGPPEPKYMVGEPYHDYQLDVRPLSPGTKPDPTLGILVQSLIAAQGQLRSELLT